MGVGIWNLVYVISPGCNGESNTHNKYNCTKNIHNPIKYYTIQGLEKTIADKLLKPVRININEFLPRKIHHYSGMPFGNIPGTLSL
jgi:hypothetical protein